MSNQIPERLINFNVYNEADRLLGLATVELPSLESMTDTVSGAGIAGEIDSPIMGHFGSMTTTITFRTITNDALSLAAPKTHAIDVRGAQQIHDAGTGQLTAQPVRVAMRCMPKNVSLGSFEVGSTTDTENEFEVTYIKIWINGVERIEIDKLNFIYKVDGVDYLAQVRAAMGQ